MLKTTVPVESLLGVVSAGLIRVGVAAIALQFSQAAVALPHALGNVARAKQDNNKTHTSVNAEAIAATPNEICHHLVMVSCELYRQYFQAP